MRYVHKIVTVLLAVCVIVQGFMIHGISKTQEEYRAETTKNAEISQQAFRFMGTALILAGVLVNTGETVEINPALGPK